MKISRLSSLALGMLPLSTFATVIPENLMISEVDADTTGTDTMEFIELYNNSGATIDFSFTPFTVVLFNGANDLSYAAFGLTTGTLGAGELFMIGSAGVPGVDFTTPANQMQNGADAVALYSGDLVSVFGDVSAAPTTTDLVDALVYDTNDGDDIGLLDGLGLTTQFNEGELGEKDTFSNTRIFATGEFANMFATPDSLGDQVSAVPEPSTYAVMVGLGAFALVARRRRKRA